jgi:hypothetical protein
MLLRLLACGGEELPESDVVDVPCYTLSVIDSIGSPEIGSDYAFGAISDFDWGQCGEIMILDDSQSCILVYSSEGEYVTRIGRYGRGQSELTSAVFFEVLGDGTICVRDGTKWLRYARDGEFCESVNLHGVLPMQMFSFGEYEIIGISSELVYMDAQLTVIKRLARWDKWSPLEATVVYCEVKHPLSRSNFALDLITVDLFPMLFTAGNTLIYVAPEPRTEPVIDVYTHTGVLVRKIELPYPAVPKSPREMEEEERFMEEFLSRTSNGRIQVEWKPLPDRVMIRSLGVDGMNNLWVQRGTELTPTFDVFNSSDSLVFRAVLPDREDARDWLFDVSDQGILAVPQDPEDYPVIYFLRML